MRLHVQLFFLGHISRAFIHLQHHYNLYQQSLQANLGECRQQGRLGGPRSSPSPQAPLLLLAAARIRLLLLHAPARYSCNKVFFFSFLLYVKLKTKKRLHQQTATIQHLQRFKQSKGIQVHIKFTKKNIQVKKLTREHLLHIRAKLFFPKTVSLRQCSFCPSGYRGK